jgi:hypothetical protein
MDDDNISWLSVLEGVNISIGRENPKQTKGW